MHETDNDSALSRPLHRPVMGREVLELLDPKPGQALLDLTLGTGGHALMLGEKLGPRGLIAGMDADESALRTAQKRLESNLNCRIRLFQGRFSEAEEVLEKVGIDGFDMMIADLGVGSHQLDDPGRGFSFESGDTLDMRFDPTTGRSARDVVNEEPEERLADIFYHLGQERFSRPIASQIGRRRRRQAINSARELADIAKRVYAARSGNRTWRLHPATRIFMALRIHVNRELEELDALLERMPRLAAGGAMAAVITYHSLEARRVKTAWRRQAGCGSIEIVTPKPLRPTPEEVARNPRARSAQIRAARFGMAGTSR